MRLFMMMLFVIFCVSCTTTETKIYSLYLGDRTEMTSVKRGESLAFLSVKSFKHLEQPYIVFRSSPYELSPSAYAKWDASPTEIIKDKLSERLVKRGLFRDVRPVRFMRPEAGYLIAINLKDFSRLDEPDASYGSISLTVSMKEGSGKEVYSRDFVKKTRLDDKTYLNLAKGLSEALNGLLAELANDIDRVLSPGAR